MSSYVPEWLRRLARDRAALHCEYCLIHEEDALFRHEPDHIVAEKHGGTTVAENLALACFLCNRCEGSDIASLDPITGALTRLFNPRTQEWRVHFKLDGPRIVPLTPEGRATERMLQFNHASRLNERRMLLGLGRYPRDLGR